VMQINQFVRKTHKPLNTGQALSRKSRIFMRKFLICLW